MHTESLLPISNVSSNKKTERKSLLLLVMSLGISLVFLGFVVALNNSKVIRLEDNLHLQHNEPSDLNEDSRFFITETLPLVDFDLNFLPSSHTPTFESQIMLVDSAKQSIDISVMYWDLLGTKGTDNFTSDDLNALGFNRGRLVYDSFERAAQRGVKLRFLQDNGTLDQPIELFNLQAKYPQNVFYELWDANAWYSDGIMHMKLWVIDRKSIYLGSANMDWKSLSQVKELGIVVLNSTTVGGDAFNLFQSWWEFASLSSSQVYNQNYTLNKFTSTYFSPNFQTTITSPCWQIRNDCAQQKVCKNEIFER